MDVTPKYTLYGVCTFIPDAELEELGFNLKFQYPQRRITKIYKRNNLIFGELFDRTYRYINPEIIDTIYDLDTATKKFPELFI